jgi:methyl-accepting chemotaxis protein WspA
MKSWTIAQRLYAFFGVVMLALAGGFNLYFYAVTLKGLAGDQRNQIETATANIRFDALQISDALRGVLLDPTNQALRGRRLTADERIAKQIESLKIWFQSRPELLHSVEGNRAQLNKVEGEILELAAKDSVAANAIYTGTYNQFRTDQERLLGELQDKTAREVTDRTNDASFKLWLSLVVFGGIFGGTIIAVLFFARALSLPVQKLTTAVGLLAEGDLWVVLPKARGGDEISQLTRSLERLVESLRACSEGANRVAAGDLTTEFKPQSERDVMGTALAEMGRKLAALVVDVQRSSVIVSSVITEVAATAKKQQSTANEVAATTTEISATSREITATARDLAQTVSHVAEGAQQSATLADSGRDALGRMDETMRRVSDAAGGINARLTVLNDKAANIGSVVTTIAKVADQTNLLSLNAAIEAEKAGEYGRGFAVVATEIRRLADQTAAATVDIEQLVKEIQTAVTAGVMGMDKFSEEVRRGVGDVEKVASQLAQIIQNVQAITPRIGSVSEGMQVQSSGAEQISQALTQLGDAARQIAESLHQSNEAVRRLDEAARGLRSGVERFKVRS